MKTGVAVIEVTGLRVEREAVILESIDLRVERGQHWAILGANGSGKTSLLRALTGYLPPTAGTIRVLGETYGRFDWRDLRTRIGLVSSSVHQMMDDNETALKAVVSGRYAQIGYWVRCAMRIGARLTRSCDASERMRCASVRGDFFHRGNASAC